MKKILITILMSILALSLFAQTITIGDPASGEDTYVPVYGWNDNTFSQMLYTSAELAEAGITTGEITSISFQVNTTYVLSNHNHWNVKMMETSTTDFNDEEWVDTTGNLATVVFNGNHNAGTLTAGQWITITLTTPFTYTGAQNLLIQVATIDGAYYNDFYFRGHETDDYMAYVNVRDNVGFDLEDMDDWDIATGSYDYVGTDYRPNIRISYLPPITNGPDLAVIAFTGPTRLPGLTADMRITVMNMGNTPATTSNYTLQVSVVGSNATPYTVPGLVALGDPRESHVYNIRASVYNQWLTGVGDVEFEAKVIFDGDLNTANDARTITAAKVGERDIEVYSITGIGAAFKLPTTQDISIVLRNAGTTNIAASDYTLTLFEGENQTPLAINFTALPLTGGATATFTVTATELNNAGFTTRNTPVTLKAKATWAADQIQGNNEKVVTTQFVDAIAESTIGGNDSDYNIPFDTYYQDSVAQSIYRAADLDNVEAGVITHIMYRFLRDTATNPANYPVNIYLANYTKASFTTNSDWVPLAEFTQVVNNYDLKLMALPAGEHEIWIPLSTPFLYTGGDLVVMTYKDHSAYSGTTEKFFITATSAGSNISLKKQTDNAGSTYANSLTSGNGTRYNYKPQARFAFNTSGSNTADLAITTFTVPAYIPGTVTDIINISVINLSATAATGYSVALFEKGAQNAIYTIPSEEIVALPTLFASHTYTIPSSAFNPLTYTVGDNKAFEAKVTIADDANTANNTREAVVTKIYVPTTPPLAVTLGYPGANATLVPVKPTFTWTKAANSINPTGYKLYLKVAETEPTEWVAGDIQTDTPYTSYTPANNLAPLAGDNKYWWKVVPYVGTTLEPVDPATNTARSFTIALVAPQTLTFTEGWETSDANWTILNASQTNKWIRGEATANTAAGTYSMYITNSTGDNNDDNTYTANSTSTVHFFTDINFNDVDSNFLLSFDVKVGGDNNDYLQVFLVPTTTTIAAGTQLTTGQLGSNINSVTTWTKQYRDIPKSWAGTTGRLVFTWRNNNSGATQPPAAVDNIEVKIVQPTDIFATTLSAPADEAILRPTKPTFTWTATTIGHAPTGYKLYVKASENEPATFDPATDLLATIPSPTLTYTPTTDLLPATPYWWTVVPYVTVSGIDQTPATNPKRSFTTASVTQTLAINEGWEGETVNWTILNGTQTNKWVLGTDVANGGTKSMYISNDGTTNAYVNTASTVHFFTDIAFDEHDATFQLSFDTKLKGNSANYLRVSLVQTSTNPAAGTNITSGQLGSNIFFEQEAWTTVYRNIPTSWAGTTGRLVFTWVNTTAAVADLLPPPAIDNISVIKVMPNTPPLATTLTSPSNNAKFLSVTPTLTWTANTIGNPPIGYKVFMQASTTDINPTTELTDVTTTTYTVTTPLAAGTKYYWKVVPYTQGTTLATDPCPIWSFSTFGDLDQVILDENFEDNPEWQFANSASASNNKWVINARPGNPGGGNSLYVSSSTAAPYQHNYSNGAISVYAYKDIDFTNLPNNTGQITMFLDIMVGGEGTSTIYDYLRVYMMPASTTLVSGSNANASSPDTYSTSIIGNNYYNFLGSDPYTSWVSMQINIPSSWVGQIGRLAFKWNNDGSGGTQPPAAIDNIRIIAEVLPPDTPPLPVVLTAPAPNAAGIPTTTTLTWAPATGSVIATGYEVYLKASETAPTEWVAGDMVANVTTGTSYEATLVMETKYYWRVVPYVIHNGATIYPPTTATNEVRSFTTVPAPYNGTAFTEDWENGIGKWITVNGTQVNQWHLGTATANGTGTHSMYVSNDGGATNAYQYSGTGAASVVHFYADFTFPALATAINLDFDIIGVAETTYDYVRVYMLDPSGTPPAAGTQLTTGQIGDTNYSAITSWTTKHINIPITWAGRTGRLVFSWRNDGSDTNGAPSAIDNIAVTSTIPAPDEPPLIAINPSPASPTTMVGTTPTLTWAPGVGSNPPTNYKVYLGTSSTLTEGDLKDTVTEPTYTVTAPLNNNATYYWSVTPVVMYDNTPIPTTGTPTVWNFTTIEAGLVVIGNGTTSSYAPVYTNWDYTVSQMLYTAGELAQFGLANTLITNIQFQAGSSAVNLASAPHWNIRMMETAEVNMNSWIDPVNTTVVYNAAHGLSTLATGTWLNLTLQTPFIYTGTGNLLIQVIDTSTTFAGSATFAGHSTAPTNLTRYRYRDGTPFNQTNPSDWTDATSVTTRPNLRLNYVGASAGPDLTVTGFTVPAQFATATTPITITARNNGTAVSNYTLQVFEMVGETPAPVLRYNEETIQPLTTPFASAVYTIEPEVYQLWPMAGRGNVTLVARITIAGDLTPLNDSLAVVTNVQSQYDLAVGTIIGPTMLPTISSITIPVQNKGWQELEADDYVIEVFEVQTGPAPDVSIGSIDGVDIAANATKNFVIPFADVNEWSFTSAITQLKFKVVMNATDEDLTNDTGTLAVTMQSNTDAVAEVGIGGTATANNTNVPVVIANKNSITQTVYRATDLGGVDYAVITDIMYIYNSGATTELPTTYPVDISMANYTVQSTGFVNNASAWVPQTAFTSVADDFDLELGTLAEGEHEIWIHLHTPFLYTGGDLIIQVVKDDIALPTVATGANFKVTTGTNLTIYLANDSGIDLDSPLAAPTRISNRPQTVFALNTKGESNDSDLAITSFTVPNLIPNPADINMVITVLNMSRSVNVLDTNYTIDIIELYPDTDPNEPYLENTVATIESPETLPIDAGSLATEQIIIPNSVYNTWDYEGAGGSTPVTLKAVLSVAGGFTDTNPNNNEAVATTALQAKQDSLNITNLVVPNTIPSTTDITVRVTNYGRAGKSDTDYTVKFYQIYTPAGGSEQEQLLHTVTTIPLDPGQVHTFEFTPTDYAAWDYVAPAIATTFTIRAKLNFGGPDYPANNSTVVTIRPEYDLAISNFTVQATPAYADSTLLTVTVLNNGRAPILANDYQIVIQEQIPPVAPATDPTWNPVHTILKTNTEPIALASTEVYKITWNDLFGTGSDAFTATNGAITLRALVSDERTTQTPADTVATNDSRTASFNLPHEKNLAVVAITGPGYVPTLSDVEITVENKGRYDVVASAYTVTLHHVVGVTKTLIYTFGGTSGNATLPIDVFGTETYTVPAAAINTALAPSTIAIGNFNFEATVTMVGDTDDTNDFKTLAAVKSNLPTDAIVEAGIVLPAASYSAHSPFATSYRNSLSQTIYRSSYFGGVDIGFITDLNYTLYTPSVVANYGFPVTIYMANYDEKTDGFGATFDNTNWVPGELFTLVATIADLPFHTYNGAQSYWIHLDLPFLYTGGDLVIMGVSNQTSYVSQGPGAVVSLPLGDAATNNMTLSKLNNSVTYSPQDPSAGSAASYYLSNTIPWTRFAVTSITEYGKLAGTITDLQSNDPIQGVLIEQIGGQRVFSSATGTYEMYVDLSAGAAPITYTMPGLAPLSREINEFTWAPVAGIETATGNIQMQTVPAYTVTGTITLEDRGTSDNAGIMVTITDNTDATVGFAQTNAAGVYTIADVAYPYEEYTLTATFPGFKKHTHEILFDYDEDDHDIYTHSFTMEEDLVKPLYATTTLMNSGSRAVRWYEPEAQVTLRPEILYTTTSSNVYSQETLAGRPLIAIDRFPEATLIQRGLVGSFLRSVSIVPLQGDLEFEVLVWAGADPNTYETWMNEPDSPTYRETFTVNQTSNLQWKLVTLTDPVYVPPTGELWVGIKIADGSKLFSFRGASPNFFADMGDLMWLISTDPAVQGLYSMSDTVNNPDNWAITNSFFVPPALVRGTGETATIEIPTLAKKTLSLPVIPGEMATFIESRVITQQTNDHTRYFRSKYNVYREQVGTPYNPATPLNDVPIIMGDNEQSIVFEDAGHITDGNWRYIVKSVFDGTESTYLPYRESPAVYTYHVGYSTVTVSGKVEYTNNGSTPATLPNATVTFKNIYGGYEPTATCNANGEYTIQVYAGTYQIVAEGEIADQEYRYESTEERTFLAATPDVDLVAVPFYTISGIVTYGTDTILAGVEVTFTNKLLGGYAPAPDSTDATGRYTIKTFAGNFDVKAIGAVTDGTNAQAYGYFSVNPKVVGANDLAYPITIQPIYTYTGQVVYGSSNTPLTDATVTFTNPELGSYSPPAVITNATGYSITTYAATYNVVANGTALGQEYQNLPITLPIAGDNPAYNIPVLPYYTITGTVKFDATALEDGATVKFTAGLGGNSPEVVTTEDGEYSVKAFAGSYDVEANGYLATQEYQYFSSAPHIVPDDGLVLDITVAPFYTISGVVSDNAATPAPKEGVVVTLTNADPDGFTPLTSTSTATGAYEIKAFAGEYNVLAEFIPAEAQEATHGFASATAITVPIATPPYNITVYPIYTLNGIVKSSIESVETPADGITVVFTNTIANVLSPEPVVSADGGLFSIKTYAGNYNVTANGMVGLLPFGYTSPVATPYALTADVPVGNPYPITIEQLPLFEITGTVKYDASTTATPDLQPLVGATVTFTNKVDGGYGYNPPLTATTSETGEFTIETVEGEYDLLVSGVENFVPYTYEDEVTVIGPATLPQITATPVYRTVSGKTLFGETPIVGATITLTNILGELGNSPATATSNETGDFVVEKVVPGSYNVVATGIYGGQTYRFATHADSALVVGAGNITQNLAMTVARWVVSGNIALHPQSSDSQTLDGYQVTLLDAEGELANGTTAVSTGDEGTFEFAVLNGTYTIRYYKASVTPQPLTYADPIIVLNADTTGIVVEVPRALTGDDTTMIPAVTALKGNYPNPFNPSTTIAFDLAQDGVVSIDIYNVKGQRVRSLINNDYKAGRYTVVWNGDDNNGRNVGSGVYFYRMTSGHYTKTQKMLLMK